jgi:hypothetical protein
MMRPFSSALFPPTLVAFSLSFGCLPSPRGSTPPPAIGPWLRRPTDALGLPGRRPQALASEYHVCVPRPSVNRWSKLGRPLAANTADRPRERARKRHLAESQKFRGRVRPACAPPALAAAVEFSLRNAALESRALLPRFRPYPIDRAVGADPPQLTPRRLGNGR